MLLSLKTSDFSKLEQRKLQIPRKLKVFGHKLRNHECIMSELKPKTSKESPGG